MQRLRHKSAFFFLNLIQIQGSSLNFGRKRAYWLPINFISVLNARFGENTASDHFIFYMKKQKISCFSTTKRLLLVRHYLVLDSFDSSLSCY